MGVSKYSRKNVKNRRKKGNYFNSECAREIIGEIYEGMELFALTKGQFSIFDVIEVVLMQTGEADVIISTWSAYQAEIKRAKMFLDNGGIRSIRFVVDRSFMSRQGNFCELLVDSFGEDCIRFSNVHAKFIMIRNDKWNIAIRTSMNLNENKRIENFEISDDAGMCDYLSSVVDEIYENGFTFKQFHFTKLGKKSQKPIFIKPLPSKAAKWLE